MNREKYILFLREANHTEKSIVSRVRNLGKIENIFHIDIDTIVFDKEKVIKLLSDIKLLGIDTKNQNLSNALRKYYTCMTNDVLDKIF